MSRGYLALVLHAHLPFVRHPEHRYFLEENWLFEATTATYLPLLEMWARPRARRLPSGVTMTISPPLVSMLTDDVLKGALRRLPRPVAPARARGDATHRRRAGVPPPRLLLPPSASGRLKALYDSIGGDISAPIAGCRIAARSRVDHRGRHPRLPAGDRAARGACARIFASAADQLPPPLRPPPRASGCPSAATPGRRQDARRRRHPLLLHRHARRAHAAPRPRYGVYAPDLHPFGRGRLRARLESSKQVWSANEGYPGDCTTAISTATSASISIRLHQAVLPPDGIRSPHRHQVLPHHRPHATRTRSRTTRRRPWSGPP